MTGATFRCGDRVKAIALPNGFPGARGVADTEPMGSRAGRFGNGVLASPGDAR